MRSCNLKTTIHFEGNALARLAKLEYKKVFIIADPFIVSSGLIKAVTKHLDSAHIEYKVYSDVVPDPTVDKVVSGVTALVREMSPCLIAVGGGSAIDLAKCVRLFAHNHNSDYAPHFIAIPTTSGTGSEVTSFAVITDPKKNIKHALIDDFLLPNEAILDVEMVKSVPASVTADTGLDVLAHALEATLAPRLTIFPICTQRRRPRFASTILCAHIIIQKLTKTRQGTKCTSHHALQALHLTQCLLVFVTVLLISLVRNSTFHTDVQTQLCFQR